jgi:SNF2 family DNA or RNA helicase
METNKIALWSHQKEGVERATKLGYFGFLYDPGTGKSAASVHTIRHFMNTEKKLLPTLILCPPIVVDNWKKEILMHSKIPEASIHCLTGSGSKRAEILKKTERRGVFITNYEALLMEPVFKELLILFSEGNGILICDEIHRCKDTSAKRTKKAIQLADIAKYRLGLTGTPILNNLMDVFSQCRIIDRGKHFGDNFFSFRARYFYDKNRGMPRDRYFPDWRPIPNAESQIKEVLSSFTMTAKKEECIDLPPLVKKKINVPLSSEQKRLYDSMKRDLIATITAPDGQLKASVADLAIVKALRLQQIVSGILRVENDDGVESIRLKDNPRKDALKELLADIAPNHKVLVWSVFKDNYTDIRDTCESLGLRYVELHGDTKNKPEVIKNFNEDPEIRVCIGHPYAGGIGANFTASSYSIYYTRNFSLEQRLQSEARNYRGGSNIHEKITHIDLVATGTIDELVLKSLETKQELSDKVLRERLSEL